MKALRILSRDRRRVDFADPRTAVTCPSCGSQMRVYDTTAAEFYTFKCRHRRRICDKCDAKKNTIEISVNDLNRIIRTAKSL